MRGAALKAALVPRNRKNNQSWFGSFYCTTLNILEDAFPPRES